MPQIQFSLKAADRRRLIKDRLMRYIIRVGGSSVFGALILIFVYLAWVGLPLFSAAKINVSPPSIDVMTQPPLVLSIDKYGQHIFTLTADGEMAFWSHQPSQLKRSQQNPSWKQTLPFIPMLSAKAADGDWFAALGKAQKIVVGRAHFSYKNDAKQGHFTPQVEMLAIPPQFIRQIPEQVKQFTFTVLDDQIIFAFLTPHGTLDILTLNRFGTASVSVEHFSSLADASEVLITPDGQTLYVRESSDVIVVKRQQSHYRIREVVDLSEGRTGHQVMYFNVLAGGESLLVVHKDGLISQWFDVVKQDERHLTHIREFRVGTSLQFLLPDSFHKGFFCFYADGMVNNYYATTKKLVFSEHLYDQGPQVASLSANEKYLVTYRDGKLQITEINLGYPEISFSALWQKIWYENYPEPDYVWQSTSASDSFEPKFSLVPIVFGTMKAALYAMLLAVPIAVFAAIYTAYFMSPTMRRKVKPTIELMEALPTVIIGFLAGLWLAPIVERHLVSVVMTIILLPLSPFIWGALWHFAPKRWLTTVNKGWHAILLLPVLIAVMCFIYYWSFDIETWLFHGDIRVFLAQYGISFDQRNALVVGIAMGFAVIPTIFTIAEDAVFSVPKHLSDGSLALGATHWQTLVHVVLLTASPGIFSAIMIGLGRAVGETMIVLMATGNTPLQGLNIFEGMRTLAATIAMELPESEVGSSQYRLLFFAALLLFMFTFLVNALAEWVRLRLREKYRAL